MLYKEHIFSMFFGGSLGVLEGYLRSLVGYYGYPFEDNIQSDAGVQTVGNISLQTLPIFISGVGVMR